MFSVVCICLLTGGSNVTITHDALDLTVGRPLSGLGPHCIGTPWPPPRHGPSLYRNSPPPSTTGAHIWWLLKHVRLASGRCASYWNTFLLPETTVYPRVWRALHIACALATTCCWYSLNSGFNACISATPTPTKCKKHRLRHFLKENSFLQR